MGNSQLSPGSLFADRFEIAQVAGSGGMGTVYRAHDRHSGELVALKLLRPGSGGIGERERFAREAQILAELRHPGIVAYVAHGQTADGQRFLAMEWLHGQDLGQRLLNGPLPLADCLALLAHVADALTIAHQRGIIHRDLKPSNLFLCGGEIARVKILDFGIARRFATASAMTRTGVVVGTPEYMAPEQARGSRDLTPKVDLFSLGCVLYECLTGQAPFIADHIAAVLVRILFEEPASIEERRPGVPASLTAILSHLLQKDPERRTADAAMLRSEILSLGELKEAAFAVSTPSARRRALSFAEQEQSLLSIVLAAPPEDVVEVGAASKEGIQILSQADRQALFEAVQALGATTDFLANGSLLVTVSAASSAQDQAMRAARAALLIKERWPIGAVAMATGRGSIRDRNAVGEVVEQAVRVLLGGSESRLPGLAAGVLLDRLSAKLLEGRFALTTRSGGTLLLNEEREADASRPLLGKPTPCVGREGELGNLEVLLAGCIEEPAARVLLVTAPPGRGKSRLRHEFLRRQERRSEPLVQLLGRADLVEAGAPYGILRAAFRKLCEISSSQTLAEQQDRLRMRIGSHLAAADKERVVLFLGELCNVPFSADGVPMLQAARQQPKIMHDRVRRAFLDWLAAECASGPVLIVLDDLQWGDELTVAVLDEALREQAGAPLFILSFARPEVHESFPKLWNSHRLQEISLPELSRRACERLIQQVLGKQIDPELVARAIEQSAGNALFLEEIMSTHHKAQQLRAVWMVSVHVGLADSTSFRGALTSREWCTSGARFCGTISSGKCLSHGRHHPEEEERQGSRLVHPVDRKWEAPPAGQPSADLRARQAHAARDRSAGGARHGRNYRARRAPADHCIGAM